MDQNNLWTGFQMPRAWRRRRNVNGSLWTLLSPAIRARLWHDLGNSLRRALLSSIEGAAITAVKIESVEHEFSSIKGVVEDATDVILNLKQVPFQTAWQRAQDADDLKGRPGRGHGQRHSGRWRRRSTRSRPAYCHPQRRRHAQYRDAAEARARICVC